MTLALLADRGLRAGFITAVEPEDARRFWRQRLGSRPISAILATVESELEIGIEHRSEFAACRRATHEWLSQFVHPNYMTAVMALFYAVAHAGFRGAPRFVPDAAEDAESAMVVAGYDIVIAAGNRWWGVNEEDGYEDDPMDEE